MMNCRNIWGILLFSLGCMLWPTNTLAQRTASDSVIVFTLINKAEDFFTNGNYDSALWYCTKAEEWSRQKNFKKGQAFALIEATDVYIDKDDLVKADATAATVNKMGLQMKDSLVTAVSWMQMAQIKMYGDQYDAAIPLFEKSLQYYLAKHATKYSALAYNDLGFTWGAKGDLSKQSENLVESIRIYEKYFPDKVGELAVALSNLSTVYYNLNQKDKAIEYGKKSLAYREKTGDIARLALSCCNISQYYMGINNEEAEKYSQLCIKYAQESKQEARMIHAYVTAAALYNTNKKPDSAFLYESKAVELLEKSKKDPVMLARRYLALASLSRLLKKDTTLIQNYFSKSWNLLQEKNDKINLRDYYYQLSEFNRENGNLTAAYQNYRQYILYKDSLVSANTQASIAEIATKYETEKKDHEIATLQVNEKLRQLEIEKQKAVIAGNLLEAQKKQNEILVLSQQKELQDAALKQQAQELEKQKLISKNDQQQLQLSQQAQELKEKELQVQKQIRNFIIAGALLLLMAGAFVFNRYQLKKKLEQQKQLLDMRNNIARDLHDEIGSTLTSIKILSEVSKNNITKDAEKSSRLLTQIAEQSEQMQQGMSDIVWAIKPDNDKLENIVARMREYISHSLEPKNIRTRFAIDEPLLSGTLTMQQRRDLFLIFKEAVNNAVKYSGATEVTVTLKKAGGYIVLVVTDNGKGFETLRSTSSNGLKNMQARAQSMGGTATIESAINKGTIVTVNIPAT